MDVYVFLLIWQYKLSEFNFVLFWKYPCVRNSDQNFWNKYISFNFLACVVKPGEWCFPTALGSHGSQDGGKYTEIAIRRMHISSNFIDNELTNKSVKFW